MPGTAQSSHHNGQLSRHNKIGLWPLVLQEGPVELDSELREFLVLCGRKQ